LFARTGKVLRDVVALVAFFARLSGVKPPADAETLPAVVALADDDLLY
jgi:hypothetical protein